MIAELLQLHPAILYLIGAVVSSIVFGLLGIIDDEGAGQAVLLWPITWVVVQQPLDGTCTSPAGNWRGCSTMDDQDLTREVLAAFADLVAAAPEASDLEGLATPTVSAQPAGRWTGSGTRPGPG